MPRLTGAIGAFSILAEAAVVGVTVGVLCLAGPGGSLQSLCHLYMLMCRQCKPLPCPGLSPRSCSGFAAWQRAFSSVLASTPFTRTSGDSSSCCMRLPYDPRTPSRDSQSATQPRRSWTDLPARCRVDRRIWGSKGHGRGFCLDVMLVFHLWVRSTAAWRSSTCPTRPPLAPHEAYATSSATCS
jgi:hypothetical protein